MGIDGRRAASSFTRRAPSFVCAIVYTFCFKEGCHVAQPNLSVYQRLALNF